jgi:D-alanine-D-alanine ligase
MAKLLKIAVVCGGPSSEYEVSLNTAGMVMKNLDPRKYRPMLVVIKKNGLWKFGSKEPIQIGRAMEELKTFDFAFIAMHGVFGEDGRIQALLEWIDISYSGSDVLSSSMAMNKAISNDIYKTIGMNVPPYAVFNKISQDGEYKFEIPAVVKPIDGGSSVGVSIVKSKKELEEALKNAFQRSEQVMAQRLIKGREFTCGILENERGVAFALPPTEIIPKSSTFFDYKAKYDIDGSREITPADLSRPMTKKLQALALKAHRALGCAGMSRSDFILKGSTFYILETNTIPGMTETSLLPQAAKATGITFPEMLTLIITAGRRRKVK